MPKPLKISDHFRLIPGNPEGSYQMSMAATIWMAADLMHDNDTTPPEGRAKARLLVAECIALFRAHKVPLIEYLETWLMDGSADITQVLPALAEACDAVGDMAIVQVIKRVMDGQ